MAGDADQPLPPILVRRDEAINVGEAMRLTGLSDKHVRRLFEQYKLGAKTDKNGPLRISGPAMLMAFHGDLVALELLRDGRRDHPLVARYYRELGYIYVAPKRRRALEPELPPEWRRIRDMTASEIKQQVDSASAA